MPDDDGRDRDDDHDWDDDDDDWDDDDWDDEDDDEEGDDDEDDDDDELGLPEHLARLVSGRGRYPQRWYPPSRPRPVEGGIKARSQRGAIGATWWSRRFVAVLESFNLGGRLDRGKRYARTGQVVALEVRPGAVIATVQGSRVKPYRVLVSVEPFSEHDWAAAEQAMAAKAVFLAKLLAGEMPQEIEEAFADCSLSLFPAQRRDLETACSCPDWSNPCKHVAAVLYLLAEAFDDDPFLIFAWRGRTKDELLEHLRARRGGTAELPADAPPDEWPAVEPVPLEADPDRFWSAGPGLAEVAVRPRVAAVPDALLRELDAPPLSTGGKPLAELLRPAYEALTAAAVERTLGRD